MEYYRTNYKNCGAPLHYDKTNYGKTAKCEYCSTEYHIGDYVRTPEQGIFIISHINIPFEDDDKNKVCLCQNSKVVFTSINIIKQLKHSKDITDLVCEGDYVNGHKIVNEIWGEDDNNLYFEIEGGFNKAQYIREEDIKTVITKEQIKQIEFKIKE